MTVDEIATHLGVWIYRHRAMDSMLDNLYAITQADPGSPLMSEIYWLMSAHTKAVSTIVGDTQGWLEWWENECDMGRDPRAASAREGDKLTRVKTVKQLARLIARSAA